MSENMEPWRSIDGSDGFVCKPYIHIIFQRGPVPEVGINGCRIEDVIDALQERLLDHQGRELACQENDTALFHLQEARDALVARRRRRELQGVLNSPDRHESESEQRIIVAPNAVLTGQTFVGHSEDLISRFPHEQGRMDSG